MSRPRQLAALLIAAATVCGAAGWGCQPGANAPLTPPGVTLASLTVTSASFPTNGTIPVDYTCDGADKAPQLTWSAPPRGTRTFAVIADDPDAPSGTFTHWLLFNIDGEARALPGGEDPSGKAVAGTNGFARVGYAGPCPPKMLLHHYYFRLFALDAPLNLTPGASRDAIESAMQGHVLGEGTLMGTFSH